MCRLAFIEIPLSLINSVLTLKTSGHGASVLKDMNILIQSPSKLIRVSLLDFNACSLNSIEHVTAVRVNFTAPDSVEHVSFDRCFEICNDVMRLIVPVIGFRRTYMKTLIITIVEDIEDCYGLTSYANPDFTLIKLSQKKWYLSLM